MMGGTKGPRDALADLKKVFDTDFWTESSSDDDEGIGSDDSMENSSNTADTEPEEASVTRPGLRVSEDDDVEVRGHKRLGRIRRSKSLVAINQFGSRIFQQFSRKFSDDRLPSVSSGWGRSDLRIDVFGLQLSEACVKSGTELPEIVTFCIEKIEKFGVTDGIYRISGQAARVEFIKRIFEKGKVPECLTEKDVHSVASVLKMYFRTLSEPVFTYNLYKSLLSIAELPPAEQPRHLHHLVHLLPRHNLATLRYLLQHLRDLADHHEVTGMTSRNLAIVWAPNLIRPPRRDTDWTECGKHASIIESLILFFPEVFNADNNSLSPVNEVSIDLAIENVHKEQGLSKHGSVSSLSPLSGASDHVMQSNLKRSRSECADIDREQNLLRLNIKDDWSDDDSSKLSDSILAASHHVSLCQRHKKLVGTSASTKTRPKRHHHQKTSETMSKIKRALCRMVSFRNGHYQVNDESVTYSMSIRNKNPSPGHSSPSNDESSTEHNYFQELESVIQQFEFLEEELNIVDNDHSEAMNKSSTSEEFCEKMSSSEPSRLFSEEILQKLETLQNSVQEVNEMFDEPCSNNSSNSGIYFAQIVYVQ